LPELHNYIEDFEFPDEAQKKIDGFVRDTYDVSPNHNIDYKFTWHGLMGYTPNRVRLVGYDPRSNVLMYNLGCNGVGILPSIFGGWRIAEMLSGRKVMPMIFDPKE
jgi:glycine/D-amino acid oxidase-like deaminating enzyme